MRLDGVDDFLSLRREAYGFELAPLPQSLQLPTAETNSHQLPEYVHDHWNRLDLTE